MFEKQKKKNKIVIMSIERALCEIHLLRRTFFVYMFSMIETHVLRVKNLKLRR